jgi:predicted transcriptional regulator of viral defense system
LRYSVHVKNLTALYEIAEDNYGFVTVADAEDAGVRPQRLAELARRKTAVERCGYGLYRLTRFPHDELETYRLATLWPYPEQGVLSHDTALMLYGLGDVNPAKIHITVPQGFRIRRRKVPGIYAIHHEHLAPGQVTRFEGIPIVTAATAIAQAATDGLRRDLVRQAIEEGIDRGLVKRREYTEFMTAFAFNPAVDASR